VSADALIRIEGLYKSFTKGREVVHAVSGFDLDIARGEIVAVIGPNGCGKSTLLHMMAGLYRPSRGRVVYDGRMVAGVNTAVAYMTQKDNLLPWRTVRDNVALPLELTGVSRREREERADEVLERMGLRGFEARYPSELSGGMRKRASLARMLLQGAASLLLDEPFGALDAQLKLTMQTLVLRLAAEAGLTVVFVTHDLVEAVTLADRVIVCTRRPATIALEQAIDLPRPRDVTHVRFEPRFKLLYDAIWERLRQEYEEEAV
jgi:NitT/TauT family transport system ATP-binding protein